MFFSRKIIKTRGCLRRQQRRERRSKAINFEDAPWITALPWGSIHVQSSVEFWRARARLSFAIRFSLVFVSEMWIAALLCSHIVLLWFGLLWWVLSWRLGMDEKAILPPSIEINNTQPIVSCFMMGLLFWNFVDIFISLKPSISKLFGNQRINNSFDRN